MVKKFGKFFRRGDIDKVKYDISWENAQRIKTKIIKASENPYDLDIFGAGSHKFKLNEVATLEEVESFEKNNNITLPKEYRDFILNVGNGGAGPYYGIKKLDFSNVEKGLNNECVLKPNMTDEEWEKLSKFVDDDEDFSDEEYEEYFSKLYGGLFYLGTQGCTYSMMLVLNGPYRGKVVYIDEEGNKPFFTYEDNFIEWYERWLDEIIDGYDIFWFGMNMGGDEKQLIDIYNKTEDKKTRLSAIYGMGKLRGISDKTVLFLENIYLNGDKDEGKSALQIMAKHKAAKTEEYIIKDLAGNYDDVLVALKLINWYYKEDKLSFLEAVEKCFGREDILNEEILSYMSYVLKVSNKDYSEEYKKLVYNKDDELKDLAIYFLGKSKDNVKYLEEFKYALKLDNTKIVNSALEALKEVKEESLIPYYKELLVRYKENTDSVLINVIKRLGDQDESAREILEELKTHTIKEVKAEAYRTLNRL